MGIVLQDMSVSFNRISIRVNGLGKQYRIKPVRQGKPDFRETIVAAITAPFRRMASIGQDQTQEIWALSDVSFDVSQREVLGIIGKNGAGKSTLLKILSRVTSPTKGRAEIYGRLASLLEIGTGFHSELSGRENIFLNGAILGMRKEEIKRKFDDIVAFAEIEKFIDTPVKRYSSGMYVRLAFAIAAYLEPDILLIDEVLAVGDEAFKTKCLGHMRDASNAGRTVIFVSHNMAAIRSLCSRVLLLEKGQLIKIGNVDEVVETYLASPDSAENRRVWNSTISSQPILPLEFAIVNSDENSSQNFTTESEIGFDLLLKVQKPTRCVVNIKIHTPDGTSLFTLSQSLPITEKTTDNEDDKFSVDPGVYRLQAKLDSPKLRAGRYFASLSIEHAMYGSFFYEEKALEWTVANITATTTRSVRQEGYVRADCTWFVERKERE